MKVGLRAVGGCAESLEIMWHKYKPVICAKLAKNCGADIAEDIYQTLFLRIRAKECKYSGNSDVQGYLYGMAKRILSDYFRAESRQVRTSCLHEVEITGDFTSLSVTETPLENLQTAETRHALQHAIEELPANARKAVDLVYNQGHRPSESANKLGCSVKTLHDRLQYGISKLRMELRQNNHK